MSIYSSQALLMDGDKNGAIRLCHTIHFSAVVVDVQEDCVFRRTDGRRR